ncbi:MAG: FtsQ-type POTRA domain-containing protein [Bryobacteraceae bacterium]|nr:FtsQ-type POTRA domain-containing protein [Bryobacteraceae bacterium]
MAKRPSVSTVSQPAFSVAAAAARKPSRFLRTLRTVVVWTLAILSLCGGLWGVTSLEQFVINDRKFVLEGPPEPGVPNPGFAISGAVHTSEKQVTDVFLRDFGRSTYLCPIAERRRRLLGIDWVQDATVSRIWPNRIEVRIKERIPVAFAQLQGEDDSLIYAMVDAEGVLLDPKRISKIALPVLAGMPRDEKESLRKNRVKRFLRLQSELGANMDRVDEIDVSDADNLKILQVVDGRALTLMLGSQQFMQRFRNFTDNYPEIRKRLPNATVLDLRLKDRITVVAGADPPPAPEPAARSTPAAKKKPVLKSKKVAHR